MSGTPTIDKINENNSQFWERQNALLDRRIADKGLRKPALARLARERIRGLLVYYQTSIEQSLADAEEDRKWFLSRQARDAGRAKKPDALQQAILGLVGKDPSMTEAKLKDMLTRDRFPELIVEVDDETIWFVPPDGSRDERLKGAPISGLKDRLSRAKKTLKSR
jgi:hypothetical protein